MLNPKLDRLTDYPFQRLRDLLAGVEPPAGLKQLVLSLGEPQHPPPAIVSETLAAQAALWGKYPPVEGTPEFRTAVADWLRRRYRLPAAGAAAVDPDRHVLPVSGTREALFMSAQVAVVEPKGNERPLVLIPNPFYQVYVGGAVMAGAEPRFLSARRETAFLPDVASESAETLSRTAMVFLCSPSNPQGTVAGLDYLKRLIELVRAYGFVLVVDECYAEIYTETPPPGALEACAALGGGFENVLVFHSLSKRSSVPGLRSGFVAGDPDLIARFRRLRNYAAAGMPEPVLAASAALWRDEAHVEENRRRYRAKFAIAERLMAGQFGFYRPAGSFFLWLDVGDGERATRALWRDAGVRVLPGAYLARAEQSGRNPGQAYIRVALVHDEPVVEDALGRLVKVLSTQVV